MTLTVKAVEAAKPKDKPYKLADGEGLYLFVSPAGGRSWRANHMEAGKQKTRTYGRYPEMTLASARDAHRAARRAPVLAEVKTPLFREVAKSWMKKHLPGLANPKHRGQVEGTLDEYVHPMIGDTPVGELKRPALVKVLQQDSLDGKVETAHRVAGRITAVFNYAEDAGILKEHPAANLTRVLPSRKVQKPMPSIPWQEAGELLRAIDTYSEPVTRLGLLLVAHTFPRVSEVLGFEKHELREDGAIWVVPADRVKKVGDIPLPHVIPMSKQSQALVEQLMEMSGCQLVLESPDRPGHPLSENTLLFALYRLGYRGRMTVHGFRTLASTVLNEQSGFTKDVIERQLQHKETDEVRAAYNRAQYLSQRREMMNWWSDWLDAAKAKNN